MTKNKTPGQIEHVGILLWRTSRGWVERYIEALQEAGYHEITLSRSNLTAHIDPARGTRQSDLVARSRLTKQAVNQLLAELEASDLVERVVDPEDRRAKVVRYTERGMAMLREGDRIKRRMEAELTETLDAEELETLKRLLRKLG